ncbi:MAG: DUF1343 domain-containing protein [Verrucomicrobiaceae bacterium]|nr:DUF1343 domain-containing protein [Verrucomicrobiaceae bacterium]
MSERVGKGQLRGAVMLLGCAMHRRLLLAAALTAGLTMCIGPAPQTHQMPQASYGGPLMLGVDVLAARNFDLLRGKRVGLITNHTSYTRTGERTRVVFKRALGPMLTTLFAPEHGLNGAEKAGAHINDQRDPITGLRCYSLHGSYRKPQPFMLRNVDVLVFDVQDIGARSYTYISTMAVAMEAAAENGKEFVVLDRPNPLGGIRVEGPPLEARWKSFVGQIPVPYVHGMTVGELAMMAGARRMISSVPRLHVVRMQGWHRGLVWQETGLTWHRTSPNIPYPTSPAYYVTTGMLGGGANADVGIGSSNPFGVAAARGVNPSAMYAYCSRLNVPGVSFAPYSREGFGGVKLSIHPKSNTDLTALGALLLCELNRLSGGKVLQMSGDKLNLFHKVAGSEDLYRNVARGSVSSLVNSWQSYCTSFRSARQAYLLYP